MVMTRLVEDQAQESQGREFMGQLQSLNGRFVFGERECVVAELTTYRRETKCSRKLYVG
jgi:hypothetical protein